MLGLKKKEVAAGEGQRVEKKPKKGKPFLIILLIVGIVGGLFWWFQGRELGAGDELDNTMTTVAVERRDITEALEASAALEAANSYTVTPLVEEEILSAPFEEGDIVEEGTVLYELDSSDAQSSIETNEISLAGSQRSYQTALSDLNDLSLESPISGTLVTLDVSVGDEVSASTVIGSITDSTSMDIVLPFPADDAITFAIGQAATVIIDGSFEVLDAVVEHISSSDIAGIGNTIQREVTLRVTNPGALSAGAMATGSVGLVSSSNSGSFENREERTITAGVNGTISAIPVTEGDWVDDGQLLLELSSDSVENSVDSQYDNLLKAEIQLENAEKVLENYTITSPISGTVVEKFYKAGETSEQGQALCIIYDLSYLEITLAVDELDVSEVEVGQNVDITAEALPEESFRGVVTKVSVVGTAASGVTTYPVTVQITEPGNLLPGMNVDASILLTEENDTLAIPIQALARGNMVLVTADSPSAGEALEDEAPEGYVYVSVKTGVSDDSYIEITDGLTEEDTVAYASAMGTSGDTDMMMPGMGMSMGSGAPADMGGAPTGMGGGGGSGGAPSGRQ